MCVVLMRHTAVCYALCWWLGCLPLIVSRNLSEESWNLDELLKAVEEEVVARKRVSVAQTVRPRRDNHPPPSATTLVSGAQGLLVATVTKTTSQQVALWYLKSMLASIYFVRVADVSHAYVKVTLAATVGPRIPSHQCLHTPARPTHKIQAPLNLPRWY